MRHLLILGGGTAGTMMANKLAPVLDEQEWQITLVDGSEQHYYQSGFLFVPFGTYRLRDIVKPRRQYLPSGVKVIVSAIDHIDTDKKAATLGNQEVLKYTISSSPLALTFIRNKPRACSTKSGAAASSTFTRPKEPNFSVSFSEPRRVAGSF